MAGCAPSHYSKGISLFAAAAAPALDKVDASYTAVNDVHIAAGDTGKHLRSRAENTLERIPGFGGSCRHVRLDSVEKFTA
jgi:hypothetical protein